MEELQNTTLFDRQDCSVELWTQLENYISNKQIEEAFKLTLQA